MQDIFDFSHQTYSRIQDVNSWLADLLTDQASSPEEALEQIQIHLEHAADNMRSLSHEDELVPDAELTDVHRDAIEAGHPPYYRPVMLPGLDPQAAFAEKLHQLSVEFGAMQLDQLPTRCVTFDCALADLWRT